MPRGHDLKPQNFKVQHDPTQQLSTDPGVGVGIDALSRVLGTVAEMISSLCQAAAENPFIQGLLGIGADALTTAGKIFAGLQRVLDGLCGLFTNGLLPDGLLGDGPDDGTTPQTLLGGLAALIALLLDNPLINGLRDLVDNTGAVLHDIVAGAGHMLTQIGEWLGIDEFSPLGILAFIQNAVDWLWNLVASGAGAIGKTIANLVEGISDAIGGFLGSFGDGTVVNDVIEFFQNILQMVGLESLTPQGVIEFVQDALDNLWNLFTSSVGGVGKTISDLLSGFHGAFGSFLASLGDGVQLSDFIGFMDSIMSLLGLEALSPTAVIEFLQDAVDWLWNLFASGTGQIGKSISDLLNGFVTAAGQLLGSFGNGTVVTDVIDFLDSVFAMLGIGALSPTAIITFLQNTTNWLWNLFASGTGQIGKTIHDLITGFSTAAGNLLGAFGNGTVVDDVIGLVQSLVSMLGDVTGISAIVDFLQDAVDWLWNLIASGSGQVGKTIHDLVEGISGAVGGFLGSFGDGTAVDDVIGFVQSVVGLISDATGVTAILDYLQDAVDYLWNLFASGTGQVGKKISDLVDSVVGTFGGLLGAFGDGTVFTDVITFIQNLFGAFGDWLHLDEIVEFFHSLVAMLGLDDVSPSNIIAFLQQKVDQLFAIFNGFGTVGNTIHDVLTSIIDWFENLPFIRAIVGAFVPGGTDLGDISAWVGKLLDINSWIPAGNLIGQIAPNLLQIIPASHVGESPANLLTQGGFTTADTISAGAGWSWDASQNYSGTGGCVKVVCNNTTKRLYSNLIPVTQGQKMAVSVWIKWSSLNPTTGDHIGVQIQKFLGGTLLGYDTALVKSAPGASGGWVQLVGDTYKIPNGVDRIRMVLWTDATAGNIWWDDAYFAKTGLGAATDVISDIFHQGQDASPFVAGTLLDDLWSAVFGHQKTVTGSSATNLDLLNRLANVSGGSIAVDDFERTNTSNLGNTIWEQTYTNSGHGKLAIANGHDADWDGALIGGTNFCMCRFLGTTNAAATSSSDYQRVSVVLGSAPRRGANGTASNDVVCRLNSSRNYFVRARWDGAGAVTIHKYVNGVETQLTNLVGFPISGSAPAIPNAGSTLTLDAGVKALGEKWTFIAYQDGQPVLTAYDLAQDSKAESGYRGWGFAVEAQSGWPLGQVVPGKIYYWTACDQGAGSAVAGSLVSAGVNAGNLTTGTLDVANRVAANAVTNTKINSDIDGSKITAGLVNGSRVQTNLTAGHIASGTFADIFIGTGIDIGKMSTGTLDVGRIGSAAILNTKLGSDIDGSKITAGLVNGSRVQTNLTAGHIASGTFGNGFLATGIDIGKMTTGTLDVGRIGAAAILNTKLGSDIDGSKITAGLVNGSRIQTNLTAGHIASGTFGDGFIASGLSATKLTTGTLDTSRIASNTIANSHLALTGLDISKMTAGALDVGRITGNSILNSKLGSDIDGSKITAGLVNGSRIQTNLTTSHITSGTFADVFVPGLGDITLSNLNALLGGTDTTATVGEVAEQLAVLAQTVTANAAAIASLQADSDGASNSGISGGDEFERTESTLTGWDENYTSTAKATYGYYTLDGHEAVWTTVGTQTNEVFMRRTDTSDYHTNTLYQKAALVTGTVVGKKPRTGTTGTEYLYVRVKDDESQWIRAEIGDGYVRLQYKNAGTVTNWGSTYSPVTRGAGVTYELIAGTASNVNQIQLLRNGNVLIDLTFSAFSFVQGTHNGWGWGGKCNGGNYPSSVSRVTIADNVPPTVVGSTARMHRTSGSAQNLVSGSNLLTSSFFGTVDYHSQDIIADNVTGKFTVLFPGTYMVTARVEGNNIGAGSTEEIKLLLYKNGSTVIRYGETATATSGFVPFSSMALSTMVYLESLDYIQLGYSSSFSSSSVKLDGDTDGTGTYYEIALVNRSLN